MSAVKKMNTLYGHMTHKIITELKPWKSVHTDLIGPYVKPIIQKIHMGI